LASEHAHFEGCHAYLDACKERNTQVVRFLKKRLPKAILYVSRGAGNVQKDHYKILKSMEKEGVYIVKVPLSGGRIPETMKYNVPGADIMGVNIEATTARYKAQAVLALADQLKIQKGEQKDFFYKMMGFKFGNEFLPKN
jgi:L-asparaginase/Glu-tRNA(Gln) amidotransferase subunit D